MYISIVSRELISEIASSKPVSYSAIRKRLALHNQHLRIKELRSYYATYLLNNDVLAEYVDLLQGRIPKSVFVRHYLKVEDLKKVVGKVLPLIRTLDITLLSHSPNLLKHETEMAKF